MKIPDLSKEEYDNQLLTAVKDTNFISVLYNSSKNQTNADPFSTISVTSLFEIMESYPDINIFRNNDINDDSTTQSQIKKLLADVNKMYENIEDTIEKLSIPSRNRIKENIELSTVTSESIQNILTMLKNKNIHPKISGQKNEFKNIVDQRKNTIMFKNDNGNPRTFDDLKIKNADDLKIKNAILPILPNKETVTGTVGVLFNELFSVTNEASNVNYSIVEQPYRTNLPSEKIFNKTGLYINSNNGRIAWTPSPPNGEYSFTIKATNQKGAVTKTYKITLNKNGFSPQLPQKYNLTTKVGDNFITDFSVKNKASDVTYEIISMQKTERRDSGSSHYVNVNLNDYDLRVINDINSNDYGKLIWNSVPLNVAFDKVKVTVKASNQKGIEDSTYIIKVHGRDEDKMKVTYNPSDLTLDKSDISNGEYSIPLTLSYPHIEHIVSYPSDCTVIGEVEDCNLHNPHTNTPIRTLYLDANLNPGEYNIRLIAKDFFRKHHAIDGYRLETTIPIKIIKYSKWLGRWVFESISHYTEADSTYIVINENEIIGAYGAEGLGLPIFSVDQTGYHLIHDFKYEEQYDSRFNRSHETLKLVYYSEIPGIPSISQFRYSYITIYVDKPNNYLRYTKFIQISDTQINSYSPPDLFDEENSRNQMTKTTTYYLPAP